VVELFFFDPPRHTDKSPPQQMHGSHGGHTMFHTTIIGRSGFGKSTHLENEILAWPGGFVFLDPHGHSAQRIADTISCIYWDASEGLIQFNPLQNISTAQHHLVASQILYALKAIWADSWGPRLEHILIHSLLVVLANNGSILDIPRLLTDDNYRTKCLRRVHDPAQRRFWRDEFDEWDDRQRNEYTASVLNKVGQFALNPMLARTLSGNTINLTRVMDKGHRLVVSLAKSQLGEEPSHLLGALLVASLYSAAQQRDNTTPVRLFVDEFQNFITESFADILSEARKHGLFLTLCHQYLSQAPEPIIDAVLANVSQITAFRVSAEDAVVLGKEMDIEPALLTNLDKFQTRVSGQYHQVSTFPPAPTQSRLEANRRHTRANYARRELQDTTSARAL
jgi:hypothetical protein